MRPIKIAYNPGSLLSTRELLLFAKLVDMTENVDSIWIPESWGREAFSSLGALSQITSRVKLGTSITSIYTRSPATTAMAAMTLDLLSNDRLILGLGVSTPTLVENWHGVEFDEPLPRIREYVECFRQIMKGEKVNFSGRYFSVKDFKLLYPPSRRRIPVFIAAVNKNMLSLACDIADGVLLYLRPIEELKKTIPHIKSKTNQRNFEVGCVIIAAISNTDSQLARDRAAKTLAFYIAVGRFYSKFIAENGFQHEVRQICSEYARGGLEAASECVSENMLNAMTICGTGEECVKSLDKFIAAGISLPIIQVNPVGDTLASINEMVETFCKE